MSESTQNKLFATILILILIILGILSIFNPTLLFTNYWKCTDQRVIPKINALPIEYSCSQYTFELIKD
jgi:hypothetical protein